MRTTSFFTRCSIILSFQHSVARKSTQTFLYYSSSASKEPKVRSALRKLLDQQQQKTMAAAANNDVKHAIEEPLAQINAPVKTSSNQISDMYRWNDRQPVLDGAIGTHSGKFHCDEALAIGMLKLLPEFESRQIVRSRDLAELAKCAIVVDVGAEFDPSRHRYDHHQKSFTYAMRHLQPSKPWEIKLSSSGLIYCYFGRDIIAQVLNWSLTERASDIEKIYDKVYENFMQEIDAIDNGVKQTERESLRYQIQTNLSSRVSFCNPVWNEVKPAGVSNAEVEMEKFKKAIDLTQAEFLERVKLYASVWLPARVHVERAVQNRFAIDASGEIILFSEGSCPWREHLNDIEMETGLMGTDPAAKPIKFVVFADVSPNAWRVQGVPVEPHSFDLRVSLPEAWCALRDGDLQRVCGVADAQFCHANGFIGGARSCEGALKMAQLALQIYYNKNQQQQNVRNGNVVDADDSSDAVLKRQRV